MNDTSMGIKLVAQHAKEREEVEDEDSIHQHPFLDTVLSYETFQR